MREGMVAEHVPARVLHPGDVACARAGERLQTLLGSCVSVVMTDPRRTVGAMCHIVHAGRLQGVVDEYGSRNTECAGPALDTMYALLMRWGYQPHMCEAWVFGGGNMFPMREGFPKVGVANSDFVLEMLAADGVRVTFVDVGGSCYRKLDWTVGPESMSVQSVSVAGGHHPARLPVEKRQ